MKPSMGTMYWSKHLAHTHVAPQRAEQQPVWHQIR
jgi:hypothetical protein